MKSFFTKPHAQPPQTLVAFFDSYAPKLWGLMRVAQVPTAEAETILANTLLKAWQHPDRPKALDSQSLSWMMRLAHAEGLPTHALKSVLKRTKD